MTKYAHHIQKQKEKANEYMRNHNNNCHSDKNIHDKNIDDKNIDDNIKIDSNHRCITTMVFIIRESMVVLIIVMVTQ